MFVSQFNILTLQKMNPKKCHWDITIRETDSYQLAWYINIWFQTIIGNTFELCTMFGWTQKHVALWVGWRGGNFYSTSLTCANCAISVCPKTFSLLSFILSWRWFSMLLFCLKILHTIQPWVTKRLPAECGSSDSPSPPNSWLLGSLPHPHSNGQVTPTHSSTFLSGFYVVILP